MEEIKKINKFLSLMNKTLVLEQAIFLPGDCFLGTNNTTLQRKQRSEDQFHLMYYPACIDQNFMKRYES